MITQWLPAAAYEARDARRYYETQRVGLGGEFAKELRATIERIAAFPKAWPIVEEPIRRTAVNRFPYLVHYSERSDFILILGVYHARRAPIPWAKRLIGR